MVRSARRLCLGRNGSQEQAREEEDPGPLVYVETSHLFLKTFADVVMVRLGLGNKQRVFLCYCTVLQGAILLVCCTSEMGVL